MKATKPFPSFSMVLPDNIVEEADGAVVSYWKRGDSCLLQISCFRRDSGPQISALQRLNDRVEKSGTWTPFTLPVRVEGCEAAAASTTDNQGTICVHVYLVWPWLTIHVTVSRQGDISACDWVWSAVSSIRPVLM